jgi:serine protease Do
MGSGFIVSPDGYILTNAHVVSGATEVTIKLIDRREFFAKVIGIDARSDVAVLKIEADKLPVVKFGDPHELKPGQWVVAIGAPFGFENSVTVGVVSGTARSLPGNDYVPFIQTDVAVNPGNSGGPLFNLQGEVVGINSQIVSRSGGYMGLSFAIPIDVARNVEAQLIKTGRVQRGRIGVAVQDMNAQFAESFGLDRARGALVSAVEPGGPGDKAGIRPGDVILQVNGQDVERSNELPTLIASLKPGATATLGIWRNREAIEAQVRVAELNEIRARERTRGEAEEAGLLGLSVRPLTAEERQAVETRGGLVVTDVFGAAALAGVQPGDIVLAVNGNPVKTVAELRAGIKGAGRAVALLIQRGEAQIFIPIPREGSSR